MHLHNPRRPNTFEVDIRRILASVNCLLLLAVVSGCGSDFVTVTGRVTLDGEPLSDAFVEFTPQFAGGSTAYGRTDANGNYDMMFSLNQKGAMPGDNLVSITTADIGDVGQANTPERVPARYNRNSELHVEVAPGRANTIDLELSSEGARVVQPNFDSES